LDISPTRTAIIEEKVSKLPTLDFIGRVYVNIMLIFYLIIVGIGLSVVVEQRH
jgi:hypothetical protein